MSMENEQQRRQHQQAPDGSGSGSSRNRPRSVNASVHRDLHRAINLGEVLEVLRRRHERGMSPEYYLG